MFRNKEITIRSIAITLLFSLFFLAILGAVAFWFFFDVPFGDIDVAPVEITIQHGMGFDEVSLDIERLGLIQSARYLRWRYRIASRLGLAKAYQAGRYALKFGQRPSQIIKSITSPDDAQRIYTRLTIPPGLTSSKISQLIQEAKLASVSDVEYAIIALASEYPIVQTEKGLQGYIFPDTYKIENPLNNTPETSRAMAESIIRLMADNFFNILDEIEPAWRKLTRIQLHEKITFASIVEREYRVDEEAVKIAAVFNNRLKEGMALQSCATVVYTIEETAVGHPYKHDYHRFNRRIFEHYLDIDSPYNTYFHSSLPPGPIGIAGRTALEAVFHPAQIDSLYFVVKDPVEGTHVFSRDYADHLLARTDYLNQYVVKE